MTYIASIDIGSHTARLLVSQTVGDSRLFRPILRKRAYIRLAEGFHDQENEILKPKAIDRTQNALEDFAFIAGKYNVDSIHAVSTGVVRRAANREDLLNRIYEHSGIKVKIISGEKEARLTGKGVLHSLDIDDRPFMIFDLGGGSTEFIFGDIEHTSVKSVPLGAMILSQKFLTTDPPEDMAIDALEKSVDEFLQKAFTEKSHFGNDCLFVGTGGTVTTLAAMIYGIDIKDINPDKMNGLILKTDRIKDLFMRLRVLTIGQRLNLPGLDPGRADVILAGTMAVIRISRFFKSTQMMVSLSDILEGILVDNLSA